MFESNYMWKTMMTKYQDKHLVISNAFGVIDYLFFHTT